MPWSKSAASLVQMAQKTTKKQRSLSQLVVFFRSWWHKVAVFVQHMHMHAAVLTTTEWHMFLTHMIWKSHAHRFLTYVSDICSLDGQDSRWVDWILAIHSVRYCLWTLVATQFWRGQHFQPTWICAACVYTHGSCDIISANIVWSAPSCFRLLAKRSEN